jgi:superfamily II DNA helicase RecQ
MALSAITRLNEKATLSILIDVLRGSHRKEITENSFHLIKTFGVGREYPAEQWYYYITQWINMGFIEIAYDAGNVLRLGSGSREVLFENKEVQLVKMLTIAQRKEKEAAKEFGSQCIVVSIDYYKNGREFFLKNNLFFHFYPFRFALKINVLINRFYTFCFFIIDY